MGDYIKLNEENSSFQNQDLNNNKNNDNDNIYFSNVNTTYTPQLEKLDSHYDQPFSSQVKPILTTQHQPEPPPKIVLVSPQYYPPSNVNKTISVNDDESHFNSSLIFFILGFFISCLWLVNIRYLKSNNKNAKTLATVSIALFIISMVLAFILIISSAGSSRTYTYN
ncbi:hypothetical protein ACTFIZ_001916 [Dictyostelium cf. discoideum]